MIIRVTGQCKFMPIKKKIGVSDGEQSVDRGTNMKTTDINLQIFYKKLGSDHAMALNFVPYFLNA